MNIAQWDLLILSSSCAVTIFALNWMLQTTFLIAMGLCAGRLLQRRGAAFQSAIYKTTLAVVFVCPIASFAVSSAGLDLWSIESPVGFVYDELVSSKTEPPVPQNSHSFTPVGTTAMDSDSRIVPSENDYILHGGESNGSIDLKSHNSELRAKIVSATELYRPIIVDGQSEKTAVSRNETRSVAIRRFGFVAIVVTIAWIVVASMKALRLVSEVIAMNRLRSQAIVASDEAIEACKRIASDMGVKAPQVLLAPFITSPFLHGIRRPAIIIPDQANLPLHDVFVHELAHLRRFDCHWLLFRNVATTVLCFQPLLWWLARRIDVTSEEVCDDFVVKCGRDRESYATCLVDIAALSVVPSVSVAAVGMNSLRSILGRRVARILDTDRLLSTRVSNSVRTLIIGTGLIATPIVGLIGLSLSYPTSASAVFAQEESNEDTPATNLATEFTSQPSDNGLSQATKPMTVDKSVGDRNVNDRKKPNSIIADKHRQLEKHSLRGTVLEPDGRPAVGARVEAVSHQWAPTVGSHIAASVEPLDEELQELGETVTDENGGFSMTVLINEPLRISVSALKDGFAADETSRWSLVNDEPWHLRLATTNHVIKGRILDSESRPAMGAKVTIVRVQEATEPIDGWLARAKTNPKTVDINSAMGNYNESTSTLEARPLSPPEIAIFPTNHISINPSLLNDSPIVTNANGEFSIAGIGDDRLVTLRLDGDSIVSTLIQVVTREMPAVNAPDVVVANRTKKIHGCTFVYASESIQWIEGTIRDKLSGQPINDVLVYVMGSDGLSFVQSRSDEEGRYLLKGLPKNPENSSFGSNGLHVVALPSNETRYFPKASWAQQHQAAQPIRMDIELHRGIWIEGQATDTRTHRPVPVVVTYHPEMDNPHFAGMDINLLWREQEAQLQIGGRQPSVDGKFRIKGLPGKGTLRVVSVRNNMYELFSNPEMQKAIENKLIGVTIAIPQPAHAIVELNIPDGETSYEVLPALVPLETTRLHFVDAEGRQVSDCFVEGNLPKRYNQVYSGNPSVAPRRTHPNSNVEFFLGEDEERERYLVVQHPIRKIGAIVAPDELARLNSHASTKITLLPNATVTGRMVNAKKKRLSGYLIAGFGVIESEPPKFSLLPVYGTFVETGSVQSRFKTYLSNTSPVKLDEDGSFELSLPAAKGYALDIMAQGVSPTLLLRKRDLSPGELLDLGTIDVTADRKDWPTPQSTWHAGQR